MLASSTNIWARNALAKSHNRTQKSPSFSKPTSVRSFKKVAAEGGKLSEMVVHPDGVERPRSTAALKRVQMEDWRKHNQLVNEKAKAAGLKQDWSHKMSVIVVRPEIIDTLPEQWEIDYKAWKDKWDQPLLAQIPDIQPLLDEDPTKKTQTNTKKAIDTTGMDEEQIARLKRAEEIAQAETEEVIVKVGTRITEADRKNDTKSLRRKLDQKLYFIVKKNRTEHSWQFPQFPLPLDLTNETRQLREIAAEGLEKATGPVVHVHMNGNAPCGFYAYPFPQEQQKSLDCYGSKLFFYRGFYIKGDIIRSKRYVDHAWVTKEELKDYIQDESLYKYLDGILF